MRRTVLMFFVFLPVLAFAETVHQTNQMELPAAGIDRVEIICGAGSLTLRSAANLRSIRVVAQVEVENFEPQALPAFIRENVRLNLEKSGQKAVLRSEILQTGGNKKEARINLSIAVPRKIDAKIIDTSGPIRVTNFVGNLEIDDDSGKIEIETVTGNVNVTDGSGSIAIEDIRGRVTLRDGSGIIEIYHVQGDVGVTDGSGDIKIRTIEGNVTVNDDSGDIDIKRVSGNVLISEAGTGEVDVDLVEGKVTVRE